MDDNINNVLVGYLLTLGKGRHVVLSKVVAPHHVEGHVEGVQSTKTGYKHNYMMLL